MLFSRIWRNLDRLLAVAGLIISVVLFLVLFLSVNRYYEVALLLFVACSGYLLITRRRSVAAPDQDESPGKPNAFLGLSLLFFTLFSFGLLSVALGKELYSRPLDYFIAIAFMSAILALQIVWAPPKRFYTGLMLFQIILLGFSLRLTPQLIFPGLIGMDPWDHQLLTTTMLDTGHLPDSPDFSYSRLPIMHLFIGSTSLVTGLDYPLATMLSLSLMQVIILSLFTFLIGSSLSNKRAGLLGSLIVVMVPHVLKAGFSIYPNGLALLWMLIILYLSFKVWRTPSTIYIALNLLFMAVLIMTHTVTAAVTAVLLFCLWAAAQAYKRAQREKAVLSLGLIQFSLFTVGMLTWWMYASGHLAGLAELIAWGFRIPVWQASIISLEYLKHIAYTEYLLDNIGVLLFYAFGIIGSLFLLSQSRRNQYGFALVVCGYVQIAITFLLIATSLLGSLGPRWFLYIQVLMAVPAAVGLLLLVSRIPNRLASRTILFLVFLVVSFLMITNSQANIDSPIYARNVTIRTAFTTSQLQGMDTISNIYDGVVSAVVPDWSYFKFSRGMLIEESEVDSWANRDFSRFSDDIFVVRKEMLSNIFYTRSGMYKIDYDLFQVLEEQGFSLIYANGQLFAFLKATSP